MSEAQPAPAPGRGAGGRFRPKRSSERERLAVAIERHSAAAARLAAVREARAKLDLYGAAGLVTARNRAAAALAEARENEPRQLVAGLLGEAGEDVLTIAAAETQLAAAEAAVDRGRRTLAVLDEEERAAEREIEAAALYRNNAITRVVQASPAMAVLAERFEAARQLVADLSLALGAIGKHRLPDAMQLWDSMRTYPDVAGLGAQWRAALAALETDPDAELPSSQAPSE